MLYEVITLRDGARGPVVPGRAGRAAEGLLGQADAEADVAAAVAQLRSEGRKVGVVGYCWGGSLAWAAATRLKGSYNFV